MADPKVDDVYTTIATRLRGFSPPIELDDHIVPGTLKVARTTLDGISFDVKDSETLKAAVRAACDTIGERAFAEAQEPIGGIHWPLRASYKETPGIGFREIWRPRLTKRELSLADAQPNRPSPLEARLAAQLGGELNPPVSSAPPGSARQRARPPGWASLNWNIPDATRFAGAQSLPDLSSLHWGISSLWATVHIDEVGFVMAGPGGEIVVNPDFLHHLVAELWWKTKAKRWLPLWMTENVNLILPSSSHLYRLVGVEIDLLKSKTYRLTVAGTCTIYGKSECTASVTFSGRF